MSKITDHNDFPDMSELMRAARDKRVEEIEGGGMDEGRVFIHLKPGYEFDVYGGRSKSVGNAADVNFTMSLIKRSV